MAVGGVALAVVLILAFVVTVMALRQKTQLNHMILEPFGSKDSGTLTLGECVCVCVLQHGV